MSELRVTKSRLELLQGVADGAVMQHYPLTWPTYDEWDRGLGETWRSRRKTVTAAMEAMRGAGWVCLGEREHNHYKSSRFWELTDTGRTVLEANGGKP